MNKIVRITISIPQDFLRLVDAQRKFTGESRSEFFRRAAEKRLRQESIVRMDKLRLEIGLIGISTAELVKEGRRG